MAMRSFRSKLNLWVFAFMSVLFILVFVVIQDLQSNALYRTRDTSSRMLSAFLQESWERQMRSLTAMYADQLAQPVYIKDLQAIRNLALVARQHRFADSVFVLDADDVILSDGARDAADVGKVFDDSMLNGGKTLVVRAPIRVGAELLGHVVLEFDARQAEQVVNELHARSHTIFQQTLGEERTSLLLLFFIALAAGLTGAFFLARSFTRQLAVLSRGIEMIGRHEFDIPAPKRRDDEVGQLAETLRRVAASLQETSVSRDYLEQLLASMPVGIAVTDRTGFIHTTNLSLDKLYGGETAGRDLKDVLDLGPDDFSELIRKLDLDGRLGDRELSLSPGGVTMDLVLSGVILRGAPQHTDDRYFFILHDITDHKNLERRLRHLATHDHLTGLPNRRHLILALEEELQAFRRGEADPFWLVLVDLDRFKEFNDTYGHRTGDELLKEVAERLRRFAREDDLVARLGSDEFTLLLRGGLPHERAVALAQELLEALARPLFVGTTKLSPSASVGLARSEMKHHRADDIISVAEAAMNQARLQGKKSPVPIAAGKPALEDRFMEQELCEALAKSGIVNYYQPIVDPATRRVIGLEALVRWVHPEKGVLLPGSFIPEAEALGLIEEIGVRVLQNVLADMAAWSRSDVLSANEAAVPPDFFVALNISEKQLLAEHFRASLASLLKPSDIPPGRIVLEVAESVVLQDTKAVLDALESLHALGVRIAVDGFGTGNASIGVLPLFPFDFVKMDRSFITDLSGDHSGLVGTILELGRSQEMTVIVEGVEQESQCAAAVELGMRACQGNYFGKPVEARYVPPLFAAVSAS